MRTLEAQKLREGVRLAYSKAAERPGDDHPFPVGRDFAESVGYPADLLDELPAVCTNAFAGVSNLAVFADIPVGAKVLDVGSGAGLDSIIAARRTGPGGGVTGVDFSETMLERARQGAKEAGVSNLVFYLSDAEHLPVGDSSIDVALVNGVFNLSPARSFIFGELARVVRPGGSVYAAELILREALPQAVQADATNWFA